jgi:DNA-binding MarR family transcriptional regulator
MKRYGTTPERAPSSRPSSPTSIIFNGFHTATGLAYSHLALEILRTNPRLVIRGDQFAREFGLTAARWLVMGAVRDGPKSMSEIARDRGLMRQSVQEIVNEMVNQDLVTIVTSQSDKRAKLIELTFKGRSLFSKLTKRWAEQANHLSRSYTKQELAIALDVVRRMRAGLDEDKSTDQ